MQSLRTLRSSEARPRNQGSQKLNKPAPSRSLRKSRVDAKIKKRMSMRYADISSPTGYDVPNVPSIPILSQQQIREEDETVKEVADVKENPLVDDLELLGRESFDPDAYLKVKLANSTEAEIKSLQRSLQDSKDSTATELRHNVFKNYAQFMNISKEVSTLENELQELKESLSEWRSMPSVLHIDDSASVADRRRTQRSSVADLRILYANQMQTLHAEVEGSSQMVPTTPGRHVVAETDGVLLLNPATYKVEATLRLFLLDDIVFLARKRARRAAGRPAYVADQAWPLNQLLVLDTKDAGSLTNVFKIRFSNETRVLRTETAADKKNILLQFRQVAEELAAKKLKERESIHERRKSQWGTGWMDRRSIALEAVPALPDWMKEFAANEESGKKAAQKADEEARWVTDYLDNLTAAVAMREWKKAVDLVEEGETKSSSSTLLASQLSILKTKLTSSLLHSLRDPANRKTATVELCGLLVRLQNGPAAQTTLLTSRSEVVRKRIRMIVPNGNISEYIADLAVVVFTCIKHTADWYLASFKDTELTSVFVEWAAKQIEKYAEMFRAQVYCFGVDDHTVKSCKTATHTQSKKLLAEYGLDFGYLFDALLVPEPKMINPPRLHSHKTSVSVASIDTTAHTADESAHRDEDEASPLPARTPVNPAPPPRSRNRPSLVGPPPAPASVNVATSRSLLRPGAF